MKFSKSEKRRVQDFLMTRYQVLKNLKRLFEAWFEEWLKKIRILKELTQCLECTGTKQAIDVHRHTKTLPKIRFFSTEPFSVIILLPSTLLWVNLDETRKSVDSTQMLKPNSLQLVQLFQLSCLFWFRKLQLRRSWWTRFYWWKQVSKKKA